MGSVRVGAGVGGGEGVALGLGLGVGGGPAFEPATRSVGAIPTDTPVILRLDPLTLQFVVGTVSVVA